MDHFTLGKTCRLIMFTWTCAELQGQTEVVPTCRTHGVAGVRSVDSAKGLMFMSIEDETGIANAIVMPDLLHKNRMLLISENFLMVEGILQNQDNVIHIRAERVTPLAITRAEISSHDFH